MSWWKSSILDLKTGEPLKDKTTFRIGGKARFFARPKDAAWLKLLLKISGVYRIPVFILGGGSNILAADKGVAGMVIKLDSANFKKISFSNTRVKAAAGVRLAKLISMCASRNLAGAEFLAGIPGSLGGALAMNAGAWGREIKDLVENATIMDYNGDIRNLSASQIRFAYRRSSLAQYIILAATLRLFKKKKSAILADIKKYLDKRLTLQDNSLPGAGCIFKNPAKYPAGRLIDLAGLKGRRVGRAIVSSKHANFILNSGNATSGDVLRLMDLIRDRVEKKFRIELEPEIKIWQ